jgi:hypothetical protein
VQIALGNCLEAVIGQATINLIHEFGSPLRIPYPSCTALLSGGLCHARKLSLRIFVSKKGVICNCPTNICMRNFWQKAERGKITGSESTTRFPQASCFEKSTRSVPEEWGCMYNVLPWSANGMRERDGKLDSRAAKKGAKKLVSSNFATILG